MKSLRTVLSVVSIVLLGLGYIASQIAAWNGSATEYARRVDEAPIRTLALLLLLAAVILAFVPDREGTEPDP